MNSLVNLNPGKQAKLPYATFLFDKWTKYYILNSIYRKFYNLILVSVNTYAKLSFYRPHEKYNFKILSKLKHGDSN